VITWLLLALTAVGVFAVAAVAVGRETFRLGHQIPASIFDLDEAVVQVSDDLPAASQARLSHDDVRVLIAAHVEHLQAKGLVGMAGKDPEILTGDPAPGTGGDDLDDLVDDLDLLKDVVVADEDALAFVLGHVDEAGLDVADEDAYAVMAALHRHLAAIGAVGPEASA
jgi:hypothetical protein